MNLAPIMRDIYFEESKKFLFALYVQKNGHTNRRALDKATERELETLLHMLNCIQNGLVPLHPNHQKRIQKSGRYKKLQSFDLSKARMLPVEDQRTIVKQFASIYCFLLHKVFHDTPNEWIKEVSENEVLCLPKHNMSDHWRMGVKKDPKKIMLESLRNSANLITMVKGSDFFLWQICQEKDGHTNRRLLTNAEDRDILALWSILRSIQQDPSCLGSENLKRLKKSGMLAFLKKNNFDADLCTEKKRAVLKKLSSVYCYLLSRLFM